MTYETGEIGTQKNIAIFGIGDHWGAVGMAGSCWSLNPLEGQLHFVPPHALNQIETATLLEPCWSSIPIDPIDVLSCFFKCVFIYFKYLGHLRPSLIWKLVASFPSLLTWPLHEFFHSAKLFRSAKPQSWARSSIEFHEFITFLEMIFIPSFAFLAFENARQTSTWHLDTLWYTWHELGTASFHTCAGVLGIKDWQGRSNGVYSKSWLEGTWRNSKSKEQWGRATCRALLPPELASSG